jgi:hypothetical protein
LNISTVWESSTDFPEKGRRYTIDVRNSGFKDDTGDFSGRIKTDGE